MRYLKILGLAFMLLSSLPSVLSANPRNGREGGGRVQNYTTTTVAWAALDRDDWGYYDRDGYYHRYHDRDDRRYWRHHDRDDRRWRRSYRDRDDWRYRDDRYWH